MLTKPKLSTLALIVLAAFAATAVIDAQPVPFLGAGVGRDVAIVPDVDGIHITAIVEGEATHLGRFTEELRYVLSYDFVHFSGVGTFTAANGDKLFVTFTGAVPGFSSGVFPTPYTSAFVIVGGTGRFTHTTGNGLITGQDFGGGLFDAQWQGALDR